MCLKVWPKTIIGEQLKFVNDAFWRFGAKHVVNTIREEIRNEIRGLSKATSGATPKKRANIRA